MEQAHDRPQHAFGAPGTEPRWTHGAKDAIGTAYSTSSHLWFTLFRGVVNEVYFPTIDKPQLRDAQVLITGPGFVHEEKRHLDPETEALAEGALGFRVRMRDREGRYVLEKEILCDPHQSCLLLTLKLSGRDPAFLRSLRAHLLIAPHMDGDGWGDSAYAVRLAGRDILVAKGDHTWMAVDASRPLLKRSCGYVGYSDGWQDLHQHGAMTWEFSRAVDGNVAMMAALDLQPGEALTVGIAFGDNLHRAASTLYQSLGVPVSEHRARFIRQWERAGRDLAPLSHHAGDGGGLYRASCDLILAHEDKSYPGAIIASLSIPWGDARGDEDLGGFHLVWTRDICHSAMALLAAGDTLTPRRSLIYLACTQRQDGGFYQNFWIDGRPYSYEVALDEVCHPILLAWHLHQANGLSDFDPYPMVLAAAGYLVRNGPQTAKERWEELAGYSPSSLAACVAALLCAADFASQRHDRATADFLSSWADFIEQHIEAWTVTWRGDLHPEEARHYVRIAPSEGDEGEANPDQGVVFLPNQAPGENGARLARSVVDPGFLELVRYGIRRADDPLIVSSLRVVDAVLRVETPHGPAWRRYVGDGYGQQSDGGPFLTHGTGRAWPLLTGERGHYELSAGRDPRPFLAAMERFANANRLLPQQVWDAPDLPPKHLFLGESTGAAMPFLWTHAEYIRLLRSTADGKVFDRLFPVEERYQRGTPHPKIEVWKWSRQVRSAPAGATLRVQAEARFVLHLSFDGGTTKEERESQSGPLGVFWVDVLLPSVRGACEFTFYWPGDERWEGRNFQVEIRA
jgi:glucoamylase